MIFGFGLLAGGYAIFYWGLHHFCNVDCIKGEINQNGCCDNRVSLFDALGVPSKWNMPRAPAVQLNPLQTGNSTTQNQPGSPGAAPQGSPTQPQTPNNNTTPSNLGGSSSNNVGGTSLPGLQPSQSPTIPQGAYLNQNYSNPDIGAAIPIGSSVPFTGTGNILPSSAASGYGQGISHWLNNLFNNPTSPLNIVEKGVKDLWHEITGIL